MSFIVFGVTDKVIIDRAVKNGYMPTEEQISQEVARARPTKLSGEFTTPELAREFIDIIKRDCQKYRNIHIKQKEIYLDKQLKKFKTKTSAYSYDKGYKL